MENKQDICNKLLVALQATRNHANLAAMIYEKDGDDEAVLLRYRSGSIAKVNVSMDSGSAMIRDIMAAID